MSDTHVRIAAVLMDIEKELRDLLLWQQQPPPPEALASTQPFGIDTLNFAQWLQFVFLPRMHQLADAAGALPQQCGIAPMAEEYFRDLGLNSGELLRQLRLIDRILSSQ